MSLSQADLDAIAGVVDARIDARTVTVRGKTRVKRAKDTRTMAERREQGAGGVCTCGQKLATQGGADFHFGREGHDPA